jgi:hypothetical protein
VITENPYQSPQAAPSPSDGEQSNVPSRRSFLVLPLAMGIFGLGIGVASRLARPLFRGGFHVEAIAELGLKIAIGLLLVIVCRRIAGRRPLALYWCASATLWGGALMGWSVIHGAVWDDYFFINLIWMLITSGVGTVAFFVWRRRAVRKIEN